MTEFFNHSENKKEGVNEGTKAKASLQLRALEFMKNYGVNRTLEIYDINLEVLYGKDLVKLGCKLCI